MIRRNGSMPKVVGGVVLFFGAVYLVYSLNDLSGQLKDTQRTAEKYRREQDSVNAQLQGEPVIKTKPSQEVWFYHSILIFIVAQLCSIAT